MDSSFVIVWSATLGGWESGDEREGAPVTKPDLGSPCKGICFLCAESVAEYCVHYRRLRSFQADEIRAGSYRARDYMYETQAYRILRTKNLEFAEFILVAEKALRCRILAAQNMRHITRYLQHPRV